LVTWRSQNIGIERRHSEGKAERLADLATALVRLKVDLIVVDACGAPLKAISQATSTIPIVIAACNDDLVATGLISSWARMVGDVLLSFHGIVGRSAAMQALFRRIEHVAPLDVPVLIQGESGTGKELVAAAVHRLSARRDRRPQIVNCGAIPRDLLFSELFGHERGAFTGAVGRKVGLLAAAAGGTLFLDEVGELPMEAQSMLLRFLQHGEVRPLGSTDTTRVDVRLISATHRNLKAAVQQGAFRDDLRYRLRRGVLRVPPLRDRREDILLLVEHFRREMLTDYHWLVLYACLRLYCDLHNDGATGDQVGRYEIEHIDFDAIVERFFFDTDFMMGATLLAAEEAAPGQLRVTRQAWKIAAGLRPEAKDLRLTVVRRSGEDGCDSVRCVPVFGYGGPYPLWERGEGDDGDEG
jgi:hypothetical protein